MRVAFAALLAACATTTSPVPQSPDRAAAGPPSPGATPQVAAIDTALEPLRSLLGTWQGSDPDRHSTGQFTLAPELGGKVLVRRGRNDSPQGHHEDLLIVFAAHGGLRASYFDNEGHVIAYSVSASADRIELVSE